MTADRQYFTDCRLCGGNTSKGYARKHAGKCKNCVAREEDYKQSAMIMQRFMQPIAKHEHQRRS